MAAAAASVLSLCAGVAATEALVRCFDLAREPRAAYDEIRDASAARQSQAQAPALQTQIHPYLGWIRRPGIAVPYPTAPIPVFPPEQGPSEWARAQTRTNRFGFLSEWDDYRDVPADHFVVGVFGGSVAGQLVQIAGDVLRDALRERLPDIHAPIDVLAFGSGGYKQPQQVMALAQAITLGVPLDLVVNLDGFNEIRFGLLDGSYGFHPVFPSRRHYGNTVDLAGSAPSPLATELAGRIVEERHEADAIVAALESRPWLARSIAARALAGAMAQRHATAANVLEGELQQQAESEQDGSMLASLPVEPCTRGPDACLIVVTDLWANASKAMAGLAHAIGVPYVHAIQPSQYIEGGRALDEEERQFAYRESDAAVAARRGYPALRERGAKLRQEGIPFYDLTQVFAGHAETIYRDDCCHLNAHGYSILATALADAVADAVRGPGNPLAQRR